MVHLPQSSALARVRGTWWSQELEFAASMVELVHESIRVALAVGSRGKAKLPPQLRLPRPGSPKPEPKPRPKRPATVDEVRKILAAAHGRS